MKIIPALSCLWFLLCPAFGQGLDADPDVVYVEELSAQKITLKVVKEGIVFAHQKGGRQRGSLKVGSKAELIGFTDRACKVRGRRSNGEGVSGWVSPLALQAKDADFATKLKDIFKRQMMVRKLIAEKQIAIGMTSGEVTQVLGEPTTQKLRRTAEGQSATWEFIEYEIEKHYQTYRDPATGGLFRRFTHSTQIETSKTLVEFQNGVAVAIEESKNKGKTGPKIISVPVICPW